MCSPPTKEKGRIVVLIRTLSFLFPAEVILGLRGIREEAKNPSGEKVLRLIRDPCYVRSLYGNSRYVVK